MTCADARGAGRRRRVGAPAGAVAAAFVLLVAGCAASPAGPAGSGTRSSPVSPVPAVAVPRPDHVVVVVEENKSYADVIGRTAEAPFINTLAAQGASFTRSFAVAHPSQPNYLALFSGSVQGVTDDSCPHAFSTPDLGSALLAAGLTFAGYSEDLPGAGYTGCGSGGYARKHNPWVDFGALPPGVNLPFSAFPHDYAALPAVSFVVPNLTNDMHDGSVTQGDTWLKDNLAGYADWARTHNSLLVITWDEDDGSQDNRIPTVVVGQQVNPGTYDERTDHYRLLRTLEDAYGLHPVGASAGVTAVGDIWRPAP
ncbi:acid phosphatase [Streptomyces kaniharaensis]|uniref:Acid phosphatase n=1 Tax=Streptomyces kaniharaensis TaxID=212423 RepID=A0A6N7KUD8_9ACTN|nr:alkaline phosphatase family protein [Streptomyces kaniharaensis]MQS15216.1 acid phosphatase [Streptomyces kaniharaensis]